jgi:3-hydroxyisobutyrate dehydrogenase-like beta-hydroxyacid dehydrogenase
VPDLHPIRDDRSVAGVAVVGLGGMGSRIAGRLLAAGFRLAVWNRTAGKAEPLVARGARLSESPADAAASAEAIITMVADPPALRAVTEGPDGIAAGVGEATTVVEMSTVGPAAIARLASVLPAGTGLLDAPVLGSLSEAESGSLSIFVGGEAELFEGTREFLTALGTPIHVGPSGAGAAAKLVANSTLIGVIGVLGEALALAEALGLSRESAFEVLATTPIAAQADRRRAAIEADDYPPRFPLRLARKDADLISEQALDLRVMAAARSWLAEAGDGDQDYSAVLSRILQAATRR